MGSKRKSFKDIKLDFPKEFPKLRVNGLSNFYNTITYQTSLIDKTINDSEKKI